ncbi:hypothetical protein PAPYR_10596 [Paratrimastix pyriformis]|uniref:Uncharacterized protein n=1 Tax=Paratrimastix pyriformis TaxID=342808 RepID=A0ABQ8U9S5_9EUKA|nr:hypothetical protein PAPYR_10596 [Paratrimastix pyriformis]
MATIKFASRSCPNTPKTLTYDLISTLIQHIVISFASPLFTLTFKAFPVPLTTPTHEFISQLLVSPLDIWIGTLFFECAIFITPPTRARGPPTLVAHHPVHTVQVPNDVCACLNSEHVLLAVRLNRIDALHALFGPCPKRHERAFRLIVYCGMSLCVPRSHSFLEGPMGALGLMMTARRETMSQHANAIEPERS